jgi:prepilin-type processing-associated H-X9-DG protein
MSAWNNQNLSGALGPARLPQIKRPSDILMLVDTGNGMYVRDVDQGALGPEYTDSDTGKLTNVSDRHNGGANVLFVDGHVKWMMKSILADPALPGDIWGRNSY